MHCGVSAVYTVVWACVWVSAPPSRRAPDPLVRGTSIWSDSSSVSPHPTRIVCSQPTCKEELTAALVGSPHCSFCCVIGLALAPWHCCVLDPLAFVHFSCFKVDVKLFLSIETRPLAAVISRFPGFEPLQDNPTSLSWRLGAFGPLSATAQRYHRTAPARWAWKQGNNLSC